MSTSLDKDDIQRTLMTLLNQLRDSPVMNEWRARAGEGDRQTVAIAPFFNETTEHIDPQLDAMLSETETWLVNSGIAARHQPRAAGGHHPPGRGQRSARCSTRGTSRSTASRWA